jgi:hypothetical protein
MKVEFNASLVVALLALVLAAWSHVRVSDVATDLSWTVMALRSATRSVLP